MIDFEYREDDGELPQPWCAVGHNLCTGERRVWTHADKESQPIYTTGPTDTVIAYAAEAEGKCILRLGWTRPVHCIDLLPIFRSLRNTFGATPRAGLLDALAAFSLPGMATAEKDSLRKLATRGAPFTPDEMGDLVAYCHEDVTATGHLFTRLWGEFHLPHALLMGRYTLGAVAAMQTSGVPVDMDMADQVFSNQAKIKDALITAVDRNYGFYDGHTFKADRFEAYLRRHQLAWPRTLTGRPKLDDDTFKNQARLHPVLDELRELRKTLATLQDKVLPVGRDGRNRTSLMPFASRTGRNQPSASRFIFSWPKWMRHLIEPPPGKALLMLDYEQQEFLIGAVLSRDSNMVGAYESGDPYLQTAILAGAVPQGATKEQFPSIRAQFKTAVLSLQYGCGANTLGHNLGCMETARELIASHRRVYRTYHQWSVQQVDKVLLGGELATPFGWRVSGVSTHEPPNVRSIANWPVQATGGDILRIAATSLVEHGFEVAAPVHDAILLIIDLQDAEKQAAAARQLMREASKVVLGGAACRVESRLTLPGETYCREPEPTMLLRVKHILAGRTGP